MNNIHNKTSKEHQTDLSTNISEKVDRKLASRKMDGNNLWFGIGMMGIVGWSIAIPTLLGIAAGIWLDKHINDNYSWTLMMLFTGLIIGCLTAWHWIDREHKAIHKDDGDPNGK